MKLLGTRQSVRHAAQEIRHVPQVLDGSRTAVCHRFVGSAFLSAFQSRGPWTAARRRAALSLVAIVVLTAVVFDLVGEPDADPEVVYVLVDNRI